MSENEGPRRDPAEADTPAAGIPKTPAGNGDGTGRPAGTGGNPPYGTSGSASASAGSGWSGPSQPGASNGGGAYGTGAAGPATGPGLPGLFGPGAGQAAGPQGPASTSPHGANPAQSWGPAPGQPSGPGPNSTQPGPYGGRGPNQPGPYGAPGSAGGPGVGPQRSGPGNPTAPTGPLAGGGRGPAGPLSSGPAGPGAPGFSPTPGSTAVGGPGGGNKKPIALIAGLGGLALLLVIGLIAFALTRGGDSETASGGGTSAAPEVSGDTDKPQTKPVVDYLNAVQKGDAEAIKKAATVPSRATDVALTDAVLKATKDKITNVKITDPGMSDMDSTSVEASYDIKGRTYSQTFMVNKNAGNWAISDNDLPTVSVDASSPDLTVNGQKVTVPTKEYSSTEVALPPGAYTLGVAGTKFLNAVSKDVTVADDTSFDTVELESTLTPAATTEAQKQVDAFVKKCIADPQQDSDCPFYYSNYKYKAVKMPTIELSSGSLSDGEYRVTTKVAGKASYTYPDLNMTGTSAINVYGHVTFSGDKVKYDPSI